jgi:ketosteroid isomerase-like protein
VTPLEAVQTLYRAFAVRDRNVIFELLHDQVEWVQNEGFPGGGRHVGAVHVLDDVLSQFRRDWTDFGAHVQEWIADGDRVVAIGEYRGTFSTTGCPVVAAFAHVYTVTNSKIVRFRQFTDTAMFVRARAATRD